jgi:hypothetical protein
MQYVPMSKYHKKKLDIMERSIRLITEYLPYVATENNHHFLKYKYDNIHNFYNQYKQIILMYRKYTPFKQLSYSPMYRIMDDHKQICKCGKIYSQTYQKTKHEKTMTHINIINKIKLVKYLKENPLKKRNKKGGRKKYIEY